MEPVKAELTLTNAKSSVKATATKLLFSANTCFAFDDGASDKRCLELLSLHLKAKPNFALYGPGKFMDYLFKHEPTLAKNALCIVADKPQASFHYGLPVVSPNQLPENVQTVFLCSTLTVTRGYMRKKLRPGLEVLCPSILPELDHRAIPSRGWIPDYDSIYPVDIPEIEFLPNQDLILIDCPARNLAFMPNGLAYVHNALKLTGITFQTVDLDIIAYHRYHTYRLLDTCGDIVTDTGYKMPHDPWLGEAYDEWQKPEVLGYFKEEIDEIVQKLIKAKPKILGMSLQACNLRFCRTVVNGVKAALPETVILVGGFSCYQSTVGRSIFPECDYMCIGEADLIVGPLVKSIVAGECPKNFAGVMSRYDDSVEPFKEGVMPVELDRLEMVKYDWTNLKLYRNYNYYQLTPIIATRGCRWSKCTFCAERFFWRARSPKLVVDEIEWLHDQGCDLFMFNESDLNGKPELLLEICDEVARRKLRVRLTGQLRIHNYGSREFFDRLRAGGFVALRFGVDAWTTNTLKLQKKGYTTKMISQNLKDCWEAGISTEVNTVLGIPGETEQDIDETIELMVQNKAFIDRMANMNPLMLVAGGVYWLEPEKHKIKFRGNKEELYKQYPTLMPDHLWYSEEPYIDAAVRKERFVKVAKALDVAGFDIGPFMKQVIADVKSGKGAGHSARPEHANMNEKKFDWAKENENGASEQVREVMLVNSFAVDLGTPAVQEAFEVVRFQNEFYSSASDNNAENNVASSDMVAESAVTLTSKLRGKFKKAAAIFVEQGPRAVLLKVKNRMKNKRYRPPEFIDKDGLKVSVKKHLSPLTSVVAQGLHGYDILKVKYDVYAVKRGYSFDKELADANGYEKGIVFKSDSVHGVENVILEHMSLHPSDAQIAV